MDGFIYVDALTDISSTCQYRPRSLSELDPGNTFVYLSSCYQHESINLDGETKKLAGPSEIEKLTITGNGNLYIKNVCLYYVEINFEGDILFDGCRFSLDDITIHNGNVIFSQCLLNNVVIKCKNVKFTHSKISGIINAEKCDIEFTTFNGYLDVQEIRASHCIFNSEEVLFKNIKTGSILFCTFECPKIFTESIDHIIFAQNFLLNGHDPELKFIIDQESISKNIIVPVGLRVVKR